MRNQVVDSREQLEQWFVRSGVHTPLQTCIGPLPASHAAIVRWRAEQSDHSIQPVSPHQDSYRIAVMLEPMEACIWDGNTTIWGGVIAANRFRICPPGESSSWSRLSSCDIVNIFIPTTLVDEFNRQRGDAIPLDLAATRYQPDTEVLSLVHKMLDADAMAGPLAPYYCDGLVTALLAYLLEHYGRTNGKHSLADHSSLGGARLRRVLDHISERLEDDISNTQLAQLCAMSESHFTREFKRAIGMPPHQYVNRLRLERARQTLLETNMRVVDIAVQFGFHNASHFTRAFTQAFGTPPASFRRDRR